MLKRAQLSALTPADDPIFAMHDEAVVHDALLALAAPFHENRISPSPYASISTSAPGGTITPAPSYTVSCTATHTEDLLRHRRAQALEYESLLLLRSLNSARRVSGTSPVVLLPSLCGPAQEHADALLAEETSAPTSAYLPYVPHVTVRTPRSGRRRATLVSPPDMGALATVEMWFGGKYRRGLYGAREVGGVGAGMGYERFMRDRSAGSDENGAVGAEGMMFRHHQQQHHHHSEDCPCHLRIVFETMVDEGWRVVGIGRGGGVGGGIEGGKGGRWVVEFGE